MRYANNDVSYNLRMKRPDKQLIESVTGNSFRVREIDVVEENSTCRGGNSAKVDVAQVLEILTILFLSRSTRKQVRFVGMSGSITYAFGVLFVAYVTVEK